jgi:hypothetical protein
MTPISQFMGRLARVNRAPKSTDNTHQKRTTDRQTGHRRYQFNLILLHSDVHFGEGVISASSGPACLLLSPRRVPYGQQQLADPFQTFTVRYKYHGVSCCTSAAVKRRPGPTKLQLAATYVFHDTES